MDYEKLGQFYLGRCVGRDGADLRDELLLYDSRDLTTHAVCVGMTGSGKTGLGIALIEEAAIDGIPAIVIDPKGDLGNLLLTFPQLRPEDFRPWVDEAEAGRAGESPDTYAAKTAESWRDGLADWGQDGERIARMRAACDFTIFTPGSRAGAPLSLLRGFAPPAPSGPGAAGDSDPDARQERAGSTASGLLALLGIESDPLRSREHILLASLFDQAWAAGRTLDLAGLIREIQSPPFERVGVMDLETFFPQKDRSALAVMLNNLLASPGFAAWLEGEPLDVKTLLAAPDGRPRVSVISIAHLSDPERMFFVTLLLNEVLAWVRTQPGTGSLRAILYMDEIFGYFPPTANPPSKLPMLTLLKQARAFGLGIVLATQNPVDLDYKGLSNTGTWFLGRLQTERDKMRVIEGLEGASAVAGGAGGKGFDRAAMEATLAGLGKRMFLMQNVHEDAPVLFRTRWTLSWLRGPLTRAQIQRLCSPRETPALQAPGPASPGAQAAAPATGSSLPLSRRPRQGPDPDARPLVPPEAAEAFVTSSTHRGGVRLQPLLFACAQVHYTQSKLGVDSWERVSLLAPIPADGDGEPAWKESQAPVLGGEPPAGAQFAPLTASGARAKSYALWAKQAASWLYRERPLVLRRSRALGEVSRPEESEAEFRARLAHARRERRDAALERLRVRYEPKLRALSEKRSRAAARIDREQSQYDQQKMQTAISLGATVLGAVFGRKLGGAGSIGRATTTLRGAERASREAGDVEQAREEVLRLDRDVADLDVAFRAEAERLASGETSAPDALENELIAPRKGDLSIESVRLVWVPEED